MSTENQLYDNYFSNRGVSTGTYTQYHLPNYLKQQLPSHNAAILDIGCGFGQMLHALKQQGFSDLTGIELLPQAVEYCKSQLGLNVTQTGDIIQYAKQHTSSYDFILMSHVLEHLPKEQTIEVLRSIRQMLKQGGSLVLMVPNGQAPNNSYWMWEDFTHHTLFTAGSLLYVLKSAGFEQIEFLDPADLLDKPLLKRWFKKFFQKIYHLQKSFWNSVNSSGYHYASPVIYTWELKVKATK
jgi:2-polyprenyl-3-methyl-5-hydroxy-6-metoxy-1,4-benzoquinol methylase